MKVDIFISIYINDYIADTMDLLQEEHGAYILLMFHYWKKESLTSNIDKLMVISKTPESRRQMLIDLIDTYFETRGDHLYNKRLEEELVKAKSRRESARENGKKGGRPKGSKKPTKNQPVNPQKTNRFNEGKPTGNLKGNPQETHEEPTTKAKHNPEKSSSTIDYSKESNLYKGNPEKEKDPIFFSQPFRSPFHNDNPASSLLGEEPSESDEVPKYEDDNKFGTWE